jgi:hypothetical protein
MPFLFSKKQCQNQPHFLFKKINYGYALSKENAEQILKGLSPLK